MSFNELLKKYEKQGYDRQGKRKTKLAEYVCLFKDREGFLNFGQDAVFLYHVDGDVTLAHTNDFLKRYKKIHDEEGFDSDDKGILRYAGTLNTSAFRKMARNVLDSDEYASMKLQKVKPKEKTTPKKKTRAIKPKRKRLAKASKTLILNSQHHKCADCKTDISKLPVNYDHRIPLH